MTIKRYLLIFGGLLMSSKLNPYEISKKIKTNINNINRFKDGIRKNTIRFREEEKRFDSNVNELLNSIKKPRNKNKK